MMRRIPLCGLGPIVGTHSRPISRPTSPPKRRPRDQGADFSSVQARAPTEHWRMNKFSKELIESLTEAGAPAEGMPAFDQQVLERRTLARNEMLFRQGDEVT